MPELVDYTLMRSFSHASHRSGQDSLSPIAVDMAIVGIHPIVDMATSGLQCCDHLGPAH